MCNVQERSAASGPPRKGMDDMENLPNALKTRLAYKLTPSETSECTLLSKVNIRVARSSWSCGIEADAFAKITIEKTHAMFTIIRYTHASKRWYEIDEIRVRLSKN